MPPSPPANALDFAKSIARDAGRLAREKFRQPQDIRSKGRGDLVTETDLAVERMLHDAIAREFPEHRVLSEETAASTPLDGWVWVIDPIDGTRNFVSGIPFFCINIALCHDGEPAVAVTYDPNHDDLFSAQSGGGAWRNDEPVRASASPTVLASVFGFDLGYEEQPGRAMLQLVSRVFPGVQSLRIPGSAALGLAYAACGRYDLFVHHFLFPWDIAAGILLVQEAGGAITDRFGNAIGVRSRTVVAGAPGAHADFLRWQREHQGEIELPAES
jgi:fructose-1,6-bisphosphatase/inositol monophosphatase family enzyme